MLSQNDQKMGVLLAIGPVCNIHNANFLTWSAEEPKHEPSQNTFMLPALSTIIFDGRVSYLTKRVTQTVTRLAGFFTLPLRFGPCISKTGVHWFESCALTLAWSIRQRKRKQKTGIENNKLLDITLYKLINISIILTMFITVLCAHDEPITYSLQ